MMGPRIISYNQSQRRFTSRPGTSRTEFFSCTTSSDASPAGFPDAASGVPGARPSTQPNLFPSRPLRTPQRGETIPGRGYLYQNNGGDPHSMTLLVARLVGLRILVSHGIPRQDWVSDFLSLILKFRKPCVFKVTLVSLVY